MGSWNATCAATLTPIYAYDPVRLILLLQTPPGNAGNGGLVYATDAWLPISLPLAGTYGGYGRVNLLPESYPDFALLRGDLADAIVPMEATARDPGVGPDTLLNPKDLETGSCLAVVELQRAIHRSRAFCATGTRFTPVGAPGLALGMLMVHEAAYQLLSQAHTTWDGIATTPEDIVNGAADLIDAIVQDPSPVSGRFNADALPFNAHFLPLLDRQRGALTYPGSPVSIAALLSRVCLLVSDPQTHASGTDLLRRLAAFLIFHGNFTGARRVYIPTLSSGEDEDTAMHLALATLTQTLIAAAQEDDGDAD